MLAVISPAKTLDFDSPAITKKFSQPAFADESVVLINRLRELAPDDIASLMHISANLADLNYGRYADWQTPVSTAQAKQAILAFKGDVYLGLRAEDYSERDFTWAQKHLRILSGLHGLLRPLDLIAPYRLEMGTKLDIQTTKGKTRNLYEFWGNQVTDHLNAALAEQAALAERAQPILINLASKEYFQVLDPGAIKARIINVQFLDLKNDQYKFLSFYAKKARGFMASYIVHKRVKSLKQLQAFDVEGYKFCPERSIGDDWVFTRDNPPFANA